MDTPANQRLLSLDAFRGLTIAGMILVNNAGDWSHVFPPLQHAEWNGWTLADLVFPFFLFIVGVSITLSLGDSARPARILRRAGLLAALGLLLNAATAIADLGSIRVPGILQRIALCYLVSSLVFLRTGA